MDTSKGYSCEISDIRMTQENQLLVVTGIHQGSLNNSHVENLFSTSSATINYIPRNLFDEFDHLRFLDFRDNSLMSISKSNFFNCASLQEVNFGQNILQSIPASVFEICGSLTSLTFSSNVITAIDKDAFLGVSKLETLQLSYTNSFLWKKQCSSH